MPAGVRTSIFSNTDASARYPGAALRAVRDAFSSADDVRRATGVLGLVLTFFFASSFTGAIQRVYLRAWRRAPGGAVSGYTRGMTWLAAVLGYMAILGVLRGRMGNGIGIGVYVVAALAMSTALWWFTAWFLLLGQVRWRVLLPTGLITGVTLSVYAPSASIWMPEVVTNNEAQFGFFGVALALTTWFSGAAICILVGACAGPVLAGGHRMGGSPDPWVQPRGPRRGKAPPSLPAPAGTLRLRDAFRQAEEAALESPPPSASSPEPSGSENGSEDP